MRLIGEWGESGWLLPAGVLLSVGVLTLLWGYWNAPSKGMAIRLAEVLKAVALAAIALCLVDPLLSGTRPKPGANIFAVLVDDSQSMQIHDALDELSRGDHLKRMLIADTQWTRKLENEFDVRRLAFHSQLRAVDDYTELEFDGVGSALAGALKTVQRRFQGLPVAGVLMLTDGNGTDMLGDDMPWRDLPPIYAVPCGRKVGLRDLRVEQVGATQTNFESAPVTIRAEARVDGFDGTALQAVLLDERGKRVETQSVPQPQDGVATFRFQMRPERPGVSFYEVQVLPETAAAADLAAQSAEEATLANNQRLIAVDRGGGPYRVLYVSGRPNWEFKFLRRALAEDDQLELVGLIRIAKKEPKFSFRPRDQDSNRLFEGFDHPDQDAAENYDEPVLIRLGTKDADELRDGFPRTAEELYKYDAIVLDDAEAAFFTQDQLSLVEGFVSRRGGGLLALGGAECFIEGGYRRTPIGQCLPVYLDASRAKSSGGEPRYRLALTRDGWLEEWVRLRKTEPEDRVRLAQMPAFHTVNAVSAIKPGATVLAEAVTGAGEHVPALVAQRYGRGRTAALTVGDLFRWGLRRNGLSDDDLEKSWRQTVRWLVADIPRRVEVEVITPANDAPQERAIRVTVHDAEFLPLDNADVEVRVTTPDDREIALDALPDAKEAGVYVATLGSRVPGAYRARVTARGPDGAKIGEREAGWAAQPLAEEFERLAPNRRLLEEIAAKSGGEVVELDSLDAFVDGLNRRKAPITEPWIHPLWHQPAYFLAIIACLASEWGLRRWQGLA